MRSSSATSTRWASIPGSSPRSAGQGRRHRGGRQALDAGRAVQRRPHADDVRHDGRRRRQGHRDRRAGQGAGARRRGEGGQGQYQAHRGRRRHLRPRQDDGPLYRHGRHVDRPSGRRRPSSTSRSAGPTRRTELASVEDRKADTCMQRTRGAEAAFLEAVPTFDKANIVRIPYDNTMNSAIDAVTTTLTANPGAEHWIFYSCNDDGVLGSVRATENSGMKPDQVIGIGIDGSRACDAFGGGTPTGFRGTMWSIPARRGRPPSSSSSPRSRTTRRCPRRPMCRPISSTPTISPSSRARSADK